MSKIKEKIKLGDYVIDEITKYEGICTGIITWLNGCRRIGIQSEERDTRTNLPSDVYWVDETTVEVKKKQKVSTKQSETGAGNFSAPRYKEPKY